MASGSGIARKERALRRFAGRSLAGLRTASYLHKWLVLGSIIGIVAGLGAIVFYTALDLGTHYLLGELGGFVPTTTAGEGGFKLASGFSRPWVIPLVVGLGGLLSGILVFGLAPEAEGHGTDAAIDTVHHRPKGMRARVTVIKIVASALTIGSGGSGGREGPTAQISATFGSIMSRVLNLTPADSRIAVSAGMASGIGAIFRAPLGGALLGAELIYRDDLEAAALVPSLIASIVAFAVFGAVEGFKPIFGYQTWYTFDQPAQLGWYVLLGLVAGGLGRLYAVSFYGFTDAIKRIPLHPMIKPGLAGLVVGLIGLAIPGALGTGYGSVQEALDRNILLGMPLWLVLLLPLAKIVATSLSIGSGGSGGIFGPGMVIGGAAGAALWRLLEPIAPALPHSPVPFVIIGMISCFGSVAHAPLAVMLMVAEMTGNLALLAPAMIAVAFAVLVVGDTTIYRSQLRDRNESPAYRLQFGLNIAAVPVKEVMATPRLILDAALPVATAFERLTAANLPGAPVTDPQGVFVGTVRRLDLEPPAADSGDSPVGQLVDAQSMTIAVDATLEDAVEAMATSNDGWIPVLDSDMHVVGILAVGNLVHGYRLAMGDALHRLGGMAHGAVLIEERVAPDSPLVGHEVARLKLPRGTVIVTLQRQNALLFVVGDTVLQAEDLVSVLAHPESEARLRQLFQPGAAA
ncbi:MAG: chloride channel protein [Arenicellales bacterium]